MDNAGDQSSQLVTSSLGSQGLPATISPAASLPAPPNNQQTILPNPQGNVPSVAQAGDIMSVVSTTPSSGAQVAVPTQIKVRISYLYSRHVIGFSTFITTDITALKLNPIKMTLQFSRAIIFASS